MRRPLFIILQSITGLMLLGCCYYHAWSWSYPAPLVLEIMGGCLWLAFGTGLWAFRRRPGQLAFDFSTLWALLLWLIFGGIITIGAINALPVPDVFNDPYVRSLAAVFRLACYGLAVYITWAALTRRPEESLAGVGLAPILTFSLLNSRFYIETQRFTEPFVMGLVLVTLLAHLASDTSSRKQDCVWHGPNLPILLLLAAAGLATIFSSYPHQSLAVWLRLVHWALVYFLITRAVRRPEQLKRLLVLLLVLAGPVVVVPLSHLLNYGSQVGWQLALQSRLATGNVPVNGLALFSALYLNLCAGLLLAWPGRRAKWGLGLVMVCLCLCLVLTYSRAGLVGLAFGLACLFALTLYFSNKSTPDRQQAKAFWQRARHLVATDRKWMIIPALVLFLVLAATLLKVNREGANIYARLHLWKVALAMIWQHPVLGVGPGVHFLPSFAEVLSPLELYMIQHFIAYTGAHNLLLEIGQGLGLTGLGLFMWLLLAAGRDLGRSLKHARSAAQGYLLIGLAAAAAAWLGCHMFVLVSSEWSLLGESFWVLLGLIVAAGRLETGEPPSIASAVSRPGWLRVGLAGILLAVAAFVVARPIAAEAKKKQFAEAYGQRRWAEAKSAARAYLWLQPLDTEYWVALSKLSGDPGEAIAHQRRAVSLRPAYARYHTRLGWLYWKSNQPLPALAAFERAIEVDPLGLQWELHQPDLGLIYAGLGRKEQALATFRTSYNLNIESIRKPDWYLTTNGVVLHPAYIRYAATGRIDPALARLIAYHLELLRPEDIQPDPPGTPSYFLQEVTAPFLDKARKLPPLNLYKFEFFSGYNNLIKLHESFGDYHTSQALLDEAKKRSAAYPADKH